MITMLLLSAEIRQFCSTLAKKGGPAALLEKEGFPRYRRESH